MKENFSSAVNLGQWSSQYPETWEIIFNLIKENGLLHVSQISDNYVEDAMTALKVGQEIKVQVLDIDYDRGRISLTAKQGAQVNRSAQNDASRSRSSSSKQAAAAAAPALKNNAFAGLKNLKL